MEAFGKSQPVRRFEDRRFVTGEGRYVDDIAPEGSLYAVMVRSEVAHGDLAPLDLAEVREREGVVLALAAEDLEAMGLTLGMAASTVRNADGSPAAAPVRPILAKGRVRYVGEPLAVIVAETLGAAREAAEAVMPEIGERPVKLDLGAGGEALHAEAPDNVAFRWEIGDADAVEAAMAGAAHRVVTRIEDNRVMASSMEPRGCYAEWDGARLHLSFGGQGVWGMKEELARVFGLEKGAVRVTNPDVGGGFGMKAFPYPEYFACAAAAKALGRPVRWMATRSEAMMADNGGRDLVSETEMAFDAEFRLLAYRVRTASNLGAYNAHFGQFMQTELFSRVLTGVYDVQDVHLAVDGIYTNTTQVDAYRGAGRPEAILVLERSMDNAARVLGVDPWELRRRNFIPAAAFPYRSATGETYDVGDFERVLAAAEAAADRAGFGDRRAASEAAGRLRGLGLSYYIESILGDPSEGAKVAFHEDGSVSLYVGTQSNGQGHETAFAVFLSDQTGIPVERIRIVQGDSDLIAQGGGTGGSRSATVQTTATLSTVAEIKRGFAAFLAGELGAEAEAVAFDDERFRVPGSNETPTMLEVAEMARAKGRTDLLTVETRATLPGRSFPNGAHVAEVEIDPETGVVTLERYTVVDDFGNLINPLLVEGQVHGGVAQGLGQAMCERVVYDGESGQLLTASFMDYAMPRADDLPMIGFSTEPVPSTANVLGMKGCGEAGTVGALGAIANAVADATEEWGADLQMPYTPERVWRALGTATRAAAE